MKNNNIPEAKYKIGQFVMFGDGIDRIIDMTYVQSLNTWRYGLNFSQRGLCDDDFWVGGGCGYWYDENKLSAITDPVLALRAERWILMLRIKERNMANDVDNKRIACISEAQKIISEAAKCDKVVGGY